MGVMSTRGRRATDPAPRDRLNTYAITLGAACLLAPPHGARLRWLPRSVWSKMRVTMQLVPAQKRMCVLVVTHDRAFLSAACDEILELHARSAELHTVRPLPVPLGPHPPAHRLCRRVRTLRLTAGCAVLVAGSGRALRPEAARLSGASAAHLGAPVLPCALQRRLSRAAL